MASTRCERRGQIEIGIVEHEGQEFTALGASVVGRNITGYTKEDRYGITLTTWCGKTMLDCRCEIVERYWSGSLALMFCLPRGRLSAMPLAKAECSSGANSSTIATTTMPVVRQRISLSSLAILTPKMRKHSKPNSPRRDWTDACSCQSTPSRRHEHGDDHGKRNISRSRIEGHAGHQSGRLVRQDLAH